MQLGAFADDDDDDNNNTHDAEIVASDLEDEAGAYGNAYGNAQQSYGPPPPTINVSPDVYETSYTQQQQPSHHQSGYEHFTSPQHPRAAALIAGASRHAPYTVGLGGSVAAPTAAAARSMAMGSDSELNTRGLGSNKLYYVHVPPGRRARHHQHQHQQSAPHQHRRQQPQVPPAPMPRQQQQQQQYYGEPYSHQQRSLPVVAQPQQQQTHLPEQQQQQQRHMHYVTPAYGDEVTAAPAPPSRGSKGVTFDGRTSAPLYGGNRRRHERSEEQYLRTNSEEANTYSLGARTGHGQHSSSSHDAEQAHARHARLATGYDDARHALSGPEMGAGDSDVDAEDERPSSSIGSRDSYAAHSQHASRAAHTKRSSGASNSEFAAASVSAGGSHRRDSWITEDAHEPAGTRFADDIDESPQQQHHHHRQSLESGDVARGRKSRRHRHEQHQLHQRLEAGSLSDAGGATTSLSDKADGAQAGASTSTLAGAQSSHLPDVATPPSAPKSERRARAHREHQSSNERSVGGQADGGGSSQSLKSQSNLGGSTGGGLSKKSNSTTQLSLSGTKKRLGFRKKQVTMFSVHRSEEVVPQTARHLVKQATSVSSDGEGSLSNESGAK